MEDKNTGEKVDKLFSGIEKASLGQLFFTYAKIVVFTFIIPMIIAIIINEGAVLWKMFSWYQSEIDFWNIDKYRNRAILVFLFPIAYLFWFYYLTIKRAALKVQAQFFRTWNIDLAKIMAEHLIKMSQKEGVKEKFDPAVILHYINEKMSKLPRYIEWIARKLVDQIPLAEFANAYKMEDLSQNNKEKLVQDISTKLNAFQIDQINSLVPFWLIFIIPINIVCLYFLLSI